MKKIKLLIVLFVLSFTVNAQNSKDPKAKALLDQVSAKMGAYKNMDISFSSKFTNKKAGITDEAPIRGKIVLLGEKYNLDYLGNKFIFDGKQLAVINHEEEEVTLSKGDMKDEEGFIYPSKLITFYKSGYNYKMGQLKTVSGRKIQYINFLPINSNSKIVKITLGIDAKTKHIYELNQVGSNGAETTLIIQQFKSNQAISSNLFKFDKAKYLKQGYLID